MITVGINPEGSPVIHTGLASAGEIRSIDLDSGQTEFTTNEVEITIPYKDEDNDNRVDVIGILGKKLVCYTYNTARSEWEKIENSEVDTTDKAVTVKVNHFSYYGLFVPIAINLDNAHVYPNPYKPSKGHTKIWFADLTGHTRVRVFNVAGELVYDDELDTPIGELGWEVQNNNGEPIASGVYIYLLTNDANSKKKGKLAIIR